MTNDPEGYTTIGIPPGAMLVIIALIVGLGLIGSFT